jgi:hypothetical protein
LVATVPYELTRNLDATGDCLVIAADFVTIDLKCFRIGVDVSGRDIILDSAEKP